MARHSPTSARADVYSCITDEIVAAIEAGAGSWRMPWHHDGAATSRPTNAASGRRYRGINVLALWVAATKAGYGSGLWATYNQWVAAGAQVRRGERATTVVLWKELDGKYAEETEGEAPMRRRMFARAFAVFNLAQVEGYEAAPLQAGMDQPAHATAFFAALDIPVTVGAFSLPGFTEGFATVNGVRIHYVAGGKGPPLVLLPGWPETWWEFHKVMAPLAAAHRVIVVDLLGMGQSERPAGGYDKKTMAGDIAALVRRLGYSQADIVGHDIGSQVAFAMAANYPEVTHSLTMIDVAHPDAELAKWPLLPAVGQFGDKIGDGTHAYAWWFAFHQVKGLNEALMADGRVAVEQAWFFHYLTDNDAAIDPRDRAVYARAYRTPDAIRAGDAWYQAFPQDIVDDGTYAKLRMPVLAVGGPGFPWLSSTLPSKAANLRVVKIEHSGHFIPEEQPEQLVRELTGFLGK
jgi:pimeloyl-ACP methyl ester carboxylesterase